MKNKNPLVSRSSNYTVVLELKPYLIVAVALLAPIPMLASETYNEEATGPTQAGVMVRGSSLGLSFNTNRFYGEATSDFSDENGLGLAFKIPFGFVAGLSYADKNNTAYQTGFGMGYVHSFELGYLGAQAKHTDSQGRNNFADSNALELQLLAGYTLTSMLLAEGSVGHKSTRIDGYSTDKRTVGNIGLAYIQPKYAVRLGTTVGQSRNTGMLSVSIPLGGKNTTSIQALGTTVLAQNLANSGFDRTLVKTKKAASTETTSPALPAPELTITTAGLIISGADSDTVTASNIPLDPVVFTLSVNSSYTLSANTVTFPADVAGTYTQTVNILLDGEVVETKTLTVTWQ